jgi:hypothetical protein
MNNGAFQTEAAIRMADLTFAALTKPRNANLTFVATSKTARQESNWTPLVNLVGEREASNYMLMGDCEGLMLYKHCDSRRYLNIDSTTGQTFKFDPATRGYLPIPKDEALAHVGITVLRG